MNRSEQINQAIIHYLACRPDFEGVDMRDIDICKWAAEWADQNQEHSDCLEMLYQLQTKLSIAAETLEEMQYTKLNYMIDGKPVSKYPGRAALDKIKDMK